MRIDVETILAAIKIIGDFDSLPIRETELFYNGERVTLDPDLIDDYDLAGLSNRWLIDDGRINDGEWTPPKMIPYTETPQGDAT